MSAASEKQKRTEIIEDTCEINTFAFNIYICTLGTMRPTDLYNIANLQGLLLELIKI